MTNLFIPSISNNFTTSEFNSYSATMQLTTNHHDQVINQNRKERIISNRKPLVEAVLGGGSGKESTAGIKVATVALLRIGSAVGSAGVEERLGAVEELALLLSAQQGVAFS